MKRLLQFLMLGIMAAIVASGCGDSQNKGVNSGKDKPKSSEKQG
jgi:hypothetical protein